MKNTPENQNEILKELSKQAESIYDKFKAELEKKYTGKIVAIDLANKDIAGISEDKRELLQKVLQTRPKHKIGLRRIGKNPSTGYIL
ncbi:MAG: hypothetical protein ACE5KT_06095 [Methanosarcinales archaeon]